ncbi:ABC transporter ATP-binding protein [Thermaerobacillus caldiproteolyticus]|uniref:Putative ABC transport system ATP-binding protein n=1 Tax=Thermaerobacillus caldiproteolyticus TaxID=247480 RepID=A0A7V9Z9N6_9BACL|nr:ABC transporter ATP-binding protein [Anoxybacillus caldiproteolyticus]MBA2876539.1 putative ABC transport system ATP-binding protein [Anoxybacillus caldiproteolyticus]
MAILQANSITKIYRSNLSIAHRALDNFSLSIEKGEFVGVMGPSGSGKTTLLNILATIDTPTTGEVIIEGTNMAHLSKKELALFRRRQLGFVFQDFNLLDTLTIGENIILPLTLDKVPVKEMEQRLQSVAKALGIDQILDKRTYEVSGGQQQRAAIARAIIHEPLLIFADEPTGNLDSKSSKDVMDTLTSLNQQHGISIMIVTHDPFAASYCERIVFIKDGKLFTEIRKGRNQQAFFQDILDVLSLLGGNVNDISTVRP